MDVRNVDLGSFNEPLVSRVLFGALLVNVVADALNFQGMVARDDGKLGYC